MPYISGGSDFTAKRAPLLSSFTFLDAKTAPQNVLTSAECQSFVDFIDSQPLELTPPKKRGEAVRVNCNHFSRLTVNAGAQRRLRQVLRFFA
jgi:hypothetical protein